MDVDSATVRQVGVAVGAVLLFILAVSAASTVLGTAQPVDREVSGSLTGAANVSGTGLVQTEFDGRFDGQLSGDVEGTLGGAVNETGDFDGQLSGNISGEADGTIEGQVSGTITNGTLDGSLNGRINGTVDTISLGQTGGIVLVALIAVFIVGMGAAGVWLSRQD
jgi:cytoskeletal protein CcmA (bactofilin family)